MAHAPGPAGAERDQAVREKTELRPDDNTFTPSPLGRNTVAAARAFLDAWSDQGGARWVLTADEHGAYARPSQHRLCRAVDRFAMG